MFLIRKMFECLAIKSYSGIVQQRMSTEHFVSNRNMLQNLHHDAGIHVTVQKLAQPLRGLRIFAPSLFFTTKYIFSILTLRHFQRIYMLERKQKRNFQK